MTRAATPTSPLAPAAALAASFGALLAGAEPARAQLLKDSLAATRDVGVVDRRGETLPLDAEFRDGSGRTVVLRELFDGRRPVLMVPAYYDCPLLCTMVLQRVQDGLNGMEWTAGEEYRVVTFSFDHQDTPEGARRKQLAYIAGYDRPVERGEEDAVWPFLVTDAATAKRVCRALGYHYNYVPETGEYAHNAAIFFVSPDGVVHNFIEGLESARATQTYDARHLTLALSEAAEGRVGTIFDRVIASCFAYDPKTGQYQVHPMTVMRYAASACAVALGSVIAGLFVSGSIKRRRAAGRSGNPDAALAGRGPG